MLLTDESLKVANARLGWSLGMEVISFMFVIATVGIISFDRCQTRKAGKFMRKSIDLSIYNMPCSNMSFTNISTHVDLPVDDADL